MRDENDPLLDPNAITWDELRAEFDFTEEEEAEITRRRSAMAEATRKASEQRQK